jgi:hypothetical protein
MEAIARSRCEARRTLRVCHADAAPEAPPGRRVAQRLRCHKHAMGAAIVTSSPAVDRRTGAYAGPSTCRALSKAALAAFQGMAARSVRSTAGASYPRDSGP